MRKQRKNPRHDDRNREETAIHDAFWLRAHKDWRFWVVIALMLTAMATYVFTNDLAWRLKS